MQELLTHKEAAGRLIQAFSWMLIHSLWEGLLFSGMAIIGLFFAKKASAAIRYNLVLVLFAALLLCCCLTLFLELQGGGVHTVSPIGSQVVSELPAPGFLFIGRLKQLVALVSDWYSANALFVFFTWCVLFCYRSVRMSQSLIFLQRARTRQISYPDDHWKSRVEALAQKLQLRSAVRLLESSMVNTPLVIGHLKPLILIPAGLLCGLPPGQVEAVLLHELAHIRRNDYAVNLLQVITETVFCFNPGFLCLSALLREEREHCCDEIALAETGNKKELIQALVTFKEHAIYGGGYTVAFPGKGGQLLRRVNRIIGYYNQPVNLGDQAFVLTGLLGLFLFVATATIAQVGFSTGKHYTTVKQEFPKRSPIATIKPFRSRSPIRHKKRLIAVVKATDPAAGRTLAIISRPLKHQGTANADSFSNQLQNAKDKADAVNDRTIAIHDRTQALADRTIPVAAKAVPVPPIAPVNDQ